MTSYGILTILIIFFPFILLGFSLLYFLALKCSLSFISSKITVYSFHFIGFIILLKIFTVSILMCLEFGFSLYFKFNLFYVKFKFLALVFNFFIRS